MDYYYKYFKSFVKPQTKKRASREYYYQYLKSSMKSKPKDVEMRSNFENNASKFKDVEPEDVEMKNNTSTEKVLFARAPKEIKTRKRTTEPVSISSPVKTSRRGEESRKNLLKKYPALNKI